MDILRHGSDVKVISPDELKAKVIHEAEKLVKNYQK